MDEEDCSLRLRTMATHTRTFRRENPTSKPNKSSDIRLATGTLLVILSLYFQIQAKTEGKKALLWSMQSDGTAEIAFMERSTGCSKCVGEGHNIPCGEQQLMRSLRRRIQLLDI